MKNWGDFSDYQGVLETRPVYVSLQDHINAHFLICFIALTIMRIIQKKTGNIYSAERIIECLNRISCSHEHENIYLFDYRSKVSDAIGEALGIYFTNPAVNILAFPEISQLGHTFLLLFYQSDKLLQRLICNQLFRKIYLFQHF